MIVSFFNKHKWGMFAACLAGSICVLPQLFFIARLEGLYRGIHILQTPNEIGYMAMMQEILDRHPQVSSMPFFEYKDVGAPLLPTTLLYFYTIPVQLLGVSLSSMVIASKFILPAFLFFVIYLFVFELLALRNSHCEQTDKMRILFSITAGALVVLGFDLVNYSTIISYLTGHSFPSGFLIWTRPVNPVGGALLLFFFLWCLIKLILGRSKWWVVWSGISLALMMASYVFSWTIAVVILGIVALGALIKRFWRLFFRCIIISFLALVCSLPYWLKMVHIVKMAWYNEAAARIGMYYTHAPHLNKFIFGITIFFLVATLFAYYKRILMRPLPAWWWAAAVLLFSSFIVYNQQVITGREIWYYHYVFFTIPLGFVVCILILWNIIQLKYHRLAIFVIGFILFTSCALGIFQQAGAYTVNYELYDKMQDYRDVFNFFNNQTAKDSVVLVKENSFGLLDNLLLAFTHCNVYYSGENQSVLANPDDFYFRYLATLRIRGVEAGDIEKYMLENKDEVENALQYQLQRTLGFPDLKLQKRLIGLPNDYRNFVKENFYTALSKFRIDYVLAEGDLDAKVLTDLPKLHKVYSEHNIVVYKF